MVGEEVPTTWPSDLEGKMVKLVFEIGCVVLELSGKGCEIGKLEQASIGSQVSLFPPQWKLALFVTVTTANEN